MASMSAAKNTLRSMCLNLRFGLADDGVNGWPFRKDSVARLLSLYPCDFYAFQEANGFQVDFLAKALGHCGYIGRRTPAPAFWQNNVIFYDRSWICEKSDHFYLSPTPDIPSRYRKSRWPRQCTIGLFRKDARSLVVLNTHLDFANEVQVDSARVILDRLSGMSRHFPMLFMGDFNATPDSDCFDVFGQPPWGFRHALEPPPYPATHHGFSGEGKGGAVDGILFRGGMRINRISVLTDPIDGVYPSDHFPLLAQFDCPRQAG